MKKELMIKTLQSPISKANIWLTDDRVIQFGFNVHIIIYHSRFFTCDASKEWVGKQIKYSEVESIEVFR